MAKKDVKSALKESMLTEQTAVDERFKKAEEILGSNFAPADFDPETIEELPENIKVIRAGFTMPQDDYELIAGLKKKCLNFGIEITKSEIIRAGIQTLNRMTDDELLNQLNQIEKIKTGRPKQGKSLK